MKSIKLLCIIVSVFFMACSSDVKNYEPGMVDKPDSEMIFDKTKWQTKEEQKYPYRDKMLNEIMYSNFCLSGNYRE